MWDKIMSDNTEKTPIAAQPEAELDAQAKLEMVKRLLDEKKAVDVEVIELKGRTLIADYFVICTGTSNIHMKAIADGLVVDGKKLGLVKHHMEGYAPAKWILVDYGDVIVHIFSEEERSYYDIESLWKQTAEVIAKAE